MTDKKRFDQKVRITGKLVFETAFHIGSGREGELGSDMGVLLDPEGEPILPGSSLKGSFRSFAERLAGHLEIKACMLDAGLSGVECVGDEAYRTKLLEDIEKDKKLKEQFRKSEQERYDYLQKHTCDVCRLFGSPMQASKIFFSDGLLENWGESIQVRDGVCIDRDTETAREGLKYDFEVIPKNTVYRVSIEIENPGNEGKDLALVAGALGEWENGFRMGGFTSRGLGRVIFTDKKVESVKYSEKKQLLDYLISRKMTNTPQLLDENLEKFLKD